MVKFDREKILNLVNDNLKGKIMLPEIQRRFVWKPKQVLSLIDSLKKDYPIGSLLMWKTEDEIETKSFDGETKEPIKKYLEINYLLDGQQRLTSIKHAIDGEKIKVLYDLKEDNFCLEKASNKKDKNMIYLRDLFVEEEKQFRRANGEELRRILEKKEYGQTSNVHHIYLEKLREIQDIFDKEIPLIIVDRSRNYEEVSEIFIRINSKGMSINKQDLAYAKITLAIPGISKNKIQPNINNLERHNFSFNAGFLVKLIVALETGQTKSMLSDRIWKEEFKSKLNEKWDQMIESLNQSIDFLKKEVGISSLEELTTENVLVILTYLFNKRKNIDQDSEIRKKLKRWIILAQLWARYSGSSESVLDHDLKVISEKEPNDSIEELIFEITKGSRELTTEDLKTHSRNSPIFKIYYLLMKQKLGERETSKDVLSKFNKKEDHHLFPKKLLRKKGIDDKLINDLSNFTFISKKRNLNILAKDPVDYFNKLLETEGQDFFEKNLIPLDKELWSIDNYEKFLKERRKIICEQINLFLKTLKD